MADLDPWARKQAEFEKAIAECIESGSREFNLACPGYAHFYERRHNELGPDPERFDACLAELQRRLPDIEHLRVSLYDAENTDVFCRRVPGFRRLRTIDLYVDASVDDEALCRLVEHTTILPLIREIRSDWLGDDSLKAIASAAEHFTGLKEFFICDGFAFGDEGLVSLCEQARHFVSLECISSDAGHEGAPELSPAGALSLLNFTQLKRVGPLAGWSIGDEWVAALAERAGQFTQLTEISFSCCSQVGDVGLNALIEHSQHFDRLESLDLDSTSVTDEGLKALAQAWRRGEFRSLKSLYIDDLPSSVASELLWTSDAAKFFEAILDGKILPEAKLVVLGEPGVGKTSLCQRLFRRRLVDPADRRETHDFELIIPDWRPEVNGSEVRLRAWDFGGQHVLHGTHEMFLTERSVCLLVLDATQVVEVDPDSPPDEERSGNRLTYWLRMIRHFLGPDAHVILVVTKSDDPAASLPPIDLESLQKDHEFSRPIQLVREFSAADRSFKTGVDELERAIHDSLELLEMPQVTRHLVQLKELVDEKLVGRAFVSLEEYEGWCNECDVSKQSDQETYLRTLHHFGSLFYFGQLDLDGRRADERRSRQWGDDVPAGQRRLLRAERDTALQRWVINPHWLKQPVYKVIRESERREWLTEREIRECARRNVEQIVIDDPDAAGDLLLAVLKLTELCFYDAERGKYFFPRGLPRDSGRFLTGWDEADRHETVWRWEFFPETVIHRFIVKAHQNREVLDRAHWRTGVVVGGQGTTAAIRCEPELGQVVVWLKKRSDNSQRPSPGDEEFLRRIRARLTDLVGREPVEENRSWVEAGENPLSQGDQAGASQTRNNEATQSGNARRGKRKPGRPKASEKDNATKVIAALSKHHGYESNGNVANPQPATNRGLAETYDLAGNALSRFLNNELGNDGAKQYQLRCRQGTIGQLLMFWNRELPSRHTQLRDDE